jgi:hypothetical protein
MQENSTLAIDHNKRFPCLFQPSPYAGISFIT